MKLAAAIIAGALMWTTAYVPATAQEANNVVVVDHQYQPVPTTLAVAAASTALAVAESWLADNTETGVCPITRANSGMEFTYLAIRNVVIASRTAVREQCGGTQGHRVVAQADDQRSHRRVRRDLCMARRAQSHWRILME